MFGSHYYSLNGKTRTLLPRRILKRHAVEEFLSKCEKILGDVIAVQAASLLERQASFEELNRNAMLRLLGFAMDQDEYELALAIGDFFDDHP